MRPRLLTFTATETDAPQEVGEFSLADKSKVTLYAQVAPPPKGQGVWHPFTSHQAADAEDDSSPLKVPFRLVTIAPRHSMVVTDLFDGDRPLRIRLDAERKPEAPAAGPASSIIGTDVVAYIDSPPLRSFILPKGDVRQG
jgi:hypothetical protein